MMLEFKCLFQCKDMLKKKTYRPVCWNMHLLFIQEDRFYTDNNNLTQIQQLLKFLMNSSVRGINVHFCQTAETWFG